MERITVGLDFGTHQTKICIENKSDAKNPIYSFFAFDDMDGNKNVILPSIVQINKDNTLSYGFVDKSKAKYGKKFFIGGMPEYPKRYEITHDDLIPKPPVPSIFSAQPPNDEFELTRFTQNLEKAKKSYETQITLWKQKLVAQQKKIERQAAEMEEEYKNGIYKVFVPEVYEARAMYINGVSTQRAISDSVYVASDTYDDPSTAYTEDGFVQVFTKN